MIDKVVDEMIAAQRAAVKAIKRHRYETFKLEHARGFVDTATSMKTGDDQSGEALDLYRESLRIHYDTLCALTSTITANDTAFLEWQQTPAALEIMYDLDPDFRDAVEEFCRAVDQSHDIIGREGTRIHAGFYGISSAKDFAAIPGSTFNVLAQIIERARIDRDYKMAILSSKSWGLNTNYVFGDAYGRATLYGKTPQEAVEAEAKLIKSAWREPVRTQKQIMLDNGHTSYDVDEYYNLYMGRFRPYVESAVDAGVHPANVVMLPTHVGDIGHHIGPSYYHLCRDDMAMDILERTTDTICNTLDWARDRVDVYGAMPVATGSAAAAIAYVLQWDGFTTDMLLNLFQERFDNYVQKYPDHPVVDHLHVNDFLDFTSRGEKILEEGEVMGVEVDLSPIKDSEILNHPEEYAYPACAITVRATALLRFVDQPCLLAPEPPSITGMVNLCALHPEQPAAPVEMCKNCATQRKMPWKCTYCLAEDLRL